MASSSSTIIDAAEAAVDIELVKQLREETMSHAISTARISRAVTLTSMRLDNLDAVLDAYQEPDRIKSVSFYEVGMTAEQLPAALARFPNVESLCINEANIGSAALRGVSLAKLDTLSLAHSGVQHVHKEDLAGFPNLAVLFLGETNLEDLSGMSGSRSFCNSTRFKTRTCSSSRRRRRRSTSRPTYFFKWPRHAGSCSCGAPSSIALRFEEMSCVRCAAEKVTHTGWCAECERLHDTWSRRYASDILWQAGIGACVAMAVGLGAPVIGLSPLLGIAGVLAGLGTFIGARVWGTRWRRRQFLETSLPRAYLPR